MAFDLSDLGIAPPVSAATLADATGVDNGHQEVAQAKRKGLVPGSALARSLYHVWHGAPVVICDSPPGAGKSTLVVDVLIQLLERTSLSIIVANFTRRSLAELAGRLAAELALTHPDENSRPAVWFDNKSWTAPPGCVKAKPDARRYVQFKTIASCANEPPQCDVMVVDEGYQVTWSDLFTAADKAKQIFTVGDPGQIGPVVSVDTGSWEHMRRAPHKRAPEVLAMRSDVVVLRLDATYRLGQQTTDAIAPLYGFSFGSKRPARHLLGADASPLPELASQRANPVMGGINDLPVLVTVAERALELAGLSVTETHHSTGVETTRAMTYDDVAVVVAHNTQVSGVSAILASMGAQAITVGTADTLQGGQWHGVVALDPLTGHPTAGDFQLSEGRLCVMASRHMSHLTWVHDGAALETLRAVIDSGDAAAAKAAKGLVVRQRLMSADEVALDRDGF